MPKKDPRVDAYIAKAAEFAKPILKRLRTLVHEACPDIEETMKWSFPHFTRKGIVCSMAAFKQHCAFGFWKAALVIPANQAERGAMGHFGRITSLSDLPSDATLRRYVKEAVRLNEEGIQPPKKPKHETRKELVVPDYFMSAVKSNPAALATFEAFSYSHKKEYVEYVTEARTQPTRDRRLATTVAWLAEGKARNWKYERC
jgi:hypothetical protein